MKRTRRFVQALLVAGLLVMPAMQPSSGYAATSPMAPPKITPAATPAVTPAPTTQPDVETPQPLSAAEMSDRSEQLATLLGDLRQENDPARVDLDELGFALGGDADTIVDWVRHNIRFEQYPGVLRGAYGTLITRAGNSLDQALLLARLLGDAGYEIRIARGELQPDQAGELLQQIAVPRDPPTVPDQTAIDDTLAKIGALYGISATEMLAVAGALQSRVPLSQTEPYQAAAEQARAILAQLKKAKIELGADDAYASLQDEARDYYWVEYRLSSSEPWSAAQPAFADAAAAPTGLKASTVYTKSIPDDLMQRVRIRIIVEQKQGDQLTEHDTVPAVEQPAADLIGKPIAFQNYPDGLTNAGDLVDVDSVIAHTSFYLPVLNGKLVENGAAFDQNGSLIDVGMLAQSAGTEKVGSSTTNALEGAIGALDSGGDAVVTPGVTPSPTPNPADLFALTGEWIEYTLIAPGGKETTVRRTILDRIGAANRAQGKVAIAEGMDFPTAARALLTTHTIVVLPGDYTPAYVADRLLQRMIGEVALGPYITRSSTTTDTVPGDLSQALHALPPMEDVVLASALVPGAQVDPALFTWRPSPTLVVIDRGFLAGQPAKGFSRIDIVDNARRAVRLDGDALRWDPEDALRIGVWETYMEGAPLLGVGDSQFNTQLAFDWAQQQSIPLQVLAPDDTAALSALKVDPEALTNLRHDLEAGYAVIAPERTPAGASQIAWWRIDPATGQALGVGSDGRGPETSEYAITLESVLLSADLSLPGTIYSFHSCVSGGGSVGCCAAVNGATFAGGLLLGMGVTKVLGGVVSLIATDILLNGAQIGATYGNLPFPLPNVCS